jgi:hypothetical protein
MSAFEKRTSAILGGAAAVMSAQPTFNLRFRPKGAGGGFLSERPVYFGT